ncbi:MAG: metal-sulfur cluster assembly factor [Gemmatimonadaceae bacterium]|nr:metal-sulfur cluster assembly factor [Gemmatimonadaceae bacterium]
MSDHPDTAAAAVTPHSTSDDRPTVVDDSIAEGRAIPLSVATGEESSDTPGVVSEDQVKLALRRVKDPDLNLNILDLGLVYDISVTGTKVKVDMTLTSPGCPSGHEIMSNAEQEIKTLPGVESVDMNLVWTPFWTPEKMEPRVRAYLGF